MMKASGRIQTQTKPSYCAHDHTHSEARRKDLEGTLWKHRLLGLKGVQQLGIGQKCYPSLKDVLTRQLLTWCTNTNCDCLSLFSCKYWRLYATNNLLCWILNRQHRRIVRG